MEMDIYNIIGFFGAFIYMFSYFLLQAKHITSEGVEYTILNLLGAIFILISLIEHFNLPSLILQVIWIGISIYGLIKYKKTKVSSQ